MALTKTVALFCHKWIYIRMLKPEQKVAIVAQALKTALERDAYLSELVYAVRTSSPDRLHVEFLDRSQLDIELRDRG